MLFQLWFVCLVAFLWPKLAPCLVPKPTRSLSTLLSPVASVYHISRTHSVFGVGGIYSNKETTCRNCVPSEDSINAFRGPQWRSRGSDLGVGSDGIRTLSDLFQDGVLPTTVPIRLWSSPPCRSPLSQSQPKGLSAAALSPPAGESISD